MPYVSLLAGAMAVLAVACRSSSEPVSAPLHVLVELRTTGDPGAGSAGTQAIREAEARFQRTLENAEIPFEVVRRFDTIPWVAIRIAARDRDRIEALPDVIAVREDEAQRTQ